ncbi:hypothetical protein HETIRDRAFT_163075 [Heterobasidion irregulare TC 32-1]|uniref:Uncharacterized protein n=1 Tax=Heterobasidion irregulare (strain TC 32-1) TaxID=747525 RepID=W4KC49_HETIT|nr:uncharacterized protein HETIRDRAFT_163075 [Heterobasidion irregulare TC 32-1]ETW83299.1 hypothetical protein HETIRDRAFT_163075 [Heterobasidion irregulare TC 32-1]
MGLSKIVIDEERDLHGAPCFVRCLRETWRRGAQRLLETHPGATSSSYMHGSPN